MAIFLAIICINYLITFAAFGTYLLLVKESAIISHAKNAINGIATR